MPDVSRSDSNRSDSSRPRVSFNRNVHVKRINGPHTANAYSKSTDGTTFVPTSIRRERPMTKKEMTKEAEAVLKQVYKVSCTATTNIRTDDEKPKPEKRRKKTFSFLRKLDKPEKNKNSSSDVESGSSQEYRIYRVNAPPGDDHRVKIEKKTYDFMSLDRKRLKRGRKTETLDYLSLEKNTEALDKMKREKSNRTLVSSVFDRTDSPSKKPSFRPFALETKDQGKSNLKHSEDPDEQGTEKKPLTPIIETSGMDFTQKKREKSIDRMIKKLTETSLPGTLSKNTGKIGLIEPETDTCHNGNKPFSYTSADKNDHKSNSSLRNMEGLGDSKDDSKSTSPTSDVIYAQVIVGGRDGNAQKATVNERFVSNEVGSVFIGEDPNQSKVAASYSKVNTPINDDICDRLTVKSDDKNFKKTTSTSTEIFAMDRTHFPGFGTEDFTTVVKVPIKSEPNRIGERYSADLHDLSIRREILLSRSESQAKERFNSLKRLQEPSKVRKHPIATVNGIRPTEKPLRNESRISDETDYVFNDRKRFEIEKNDHNLKKKKDEGVGCELKKPEGITPKKKRESKLDTYLRETGDILKNLDKVHVIKTDDDDDNLLRKLTRFGKSKSFEQDKPRNNKKVGKMKMLFKKKKEGKGSESEEDPLSARYTEYRGSDLEFSDRSTDSSPRRTVFRVDTPRPVSISPYETSAAPKLGNLRFFGDTDQESTANEHHSPKNTRSNLPRGKNEFSKPGKFTDSDEDMMATLRTDSRATNSTRKDSPVGKWKSKYDLDSPDYGVKQMNHGLSMSAAKQENNSTNFNEPHIIGNDEITAINGLKFEPKIKRSVSSLTHATKYGTKEKLRNLKSTPAITVTSPNESFSRRVKSHGNLYTQDDKKGGRRRLYDSSAESATEGDSSQHSSKSMIYLHAATVGDIPGPRNMQKFNKGSQSGEDLTSVNDAGTVSPSGKKTLSRSFSVLAPWRPKHDKEDRTLHYNSAVDYNRGKPPTGVAKNKTNSARERKINELRFNTIGKENRRRKDLLR